MHRLRPRWGIGKHITWRCENMHCGYVDWGSGTERHTICPFVPQRDGANTPALEGEYDSGFSQRYHPNRLEHLLTKLEGRNG